MELLFVFSLILASFWSDFFSFIFEAFGLEEIERLERKITFNNF